MFPYLGLLVGVALIGIGLWDAFETIVLPRRVSRQLRVARIFYRLTWQPYVSAARRMPDGGRREAYLSYYGPLSLLFLVGVWAVVLILGFAVVHWALGSAVMTQNGQANFGTDIYLSGTTFFTLGLGDVVPSSDAARTLTVLEAGTGFAFLALVIGYVPIVYQMFARRETNVSLLDHRAGSPPSAIELMRRNVEDGDMSVLIQQLHDWEIWLADLLESHLTYPTLAYFRSQHENQSWVGAVAVILDVSAYVLACGTTRATRQAGFTFAVARHTVADLTHILSVQPITPVADRLAPDAAQRLWAAARARGLVAADAQPVNERLWAIRSAYEPYLEALSAHLLMPLPPWTPRSGATDNWETTAWDFDSPAAILGQSSPFSR